MQPQEHDSEINPDVTQLVKVGDAITFCVILNMTFAAVVFSIVVHGLTIHRMFTKDQLDGLLRS